MVEAAGFEPASFILSVPSRAQLPSYATPRCWWTMRVMLPPDFRIASAVDTLCISMAQLTRLSVVLRGTVHRKSTSVLPRLLLRPATRNS